MVYRSYRIEKYRKISNFRYTETFGTIQYRIESFRYDNDMNFLIPRYTVLYRIYDIYRYYRYTEIYRKSIRIELSIHIVYTDDDDDDNNNNNNNNNNDNNNNNNNNNKLY